MASSSYSFPPPAEDVASPSTSTTAASTTGPLSPELVQSLRIPWLNLDFPRFSSTPVAPSASSSSTSVASSSSQGSIALEQDTLAMRRMKAATARGARPPMFRRRSRSLDDADQADVENAAREMRREQSRSRSRSGSRSEEATERRSGERRISIDPVRAKEVVISPVTATSASSFASSSAPTAVPTTATTTTFATSAAASSATRGLPVSSSYGELGGVGLSRSISEPMLMSPSLASAPTHIPPVPSTSQIPQPSAFPQPDASLPHSSSSSTITTHELRLANWVSSVSSAASPSSIPAPLPPPSTASSSSISQPSHSHTPRSPGPGKLSLPPRQPYTPVLPSPLSTCSYTSEDGDADSNSASAGKDGQLPPSTSQGFPFPATPLHSSFAGGGAAAAASSSPVVAHSVQSAHTASPSSSLLPRVSPSHAHYIAGQEQRPPLQTFTSASTIGTASSVTTGGTATAFPSPAAPIASPTAASDAKAPRTARTSSVSFHPSSSSPSASASHSSSSSSPSTRLPPPSRSASGSSSLPHPSQPRTHARTASTASFASASSSSGPGGRHAAPLTPPDSLCTGPWLAGASASEMAWSDVLGAARVSATGGSNGSGGSFGGGSAMGLAGVFGAVSISGGGGIGTREKTGAKEEENAEKEAEEKKPGEGELMGNVAPGGFAALVREKVGGLVEEFLPGVEVKESRREGDGGEEEERVVGVVEYGAVKSRSASLVPPILTHFASRQPASTSPAPASSSSPALPPSGPSFQITHTSLPATDFRPLISLAEETYLRTPLAREDRVFSSFVARPFWAKVVPRGSVSVGFSCMSLHWPSTDRKFRVAPATLAHGELMAFLSARATEFAPSGLLTLAYIARSEEAAATASSPSSMPTTPSASPPLRENRSASVPTIPTAVVKMAAASRPPAVTTSSSPPAAGNIVRKKDIWAHLTSVLGQAIQRLVSTGLLKPQIARLLLALPIHPRTPRQSTACLRASAHSWDTLHSSIVTLSHPAWKGVEHGTVSPESWADHTIQLLKIFWEAEMRLILREALGSRGACEWVLDCLWTVAKEKLEEAPPHPLDLEVQLIALRRRSSPPSVPASPATSAAPLPVTQTLAGPAA